MRKNEIIAVVAFILASVGTIVAVFAAEGYRRGRTYNVELIARAPEFGNFYPSTLQAVAGEEIRLMVRNIDTVSHGFAIPELGVAVPQIKAGEVKVITFTAEEPGDYSFMCTVWCSSRHMEMRGVLQVN